ncbi:MAG: hypothetical protein DHS20C01_00020 [marine bacterium B5-7]|nr:MAG: hypothetical protein DHS20C01_00020 [marine bacterium B5-7]
MSLKQKTDLAEILKLLGESRTRATYGAVADVIGCSARRLGAMLGPRRPQASWVVSHHTNMPIGYTGDELHRDLKTNSHIITGAAELRQLLYRYRNISRQAGNRLDSQNDTLNVTPRIKNWQQFEKLIAEVYRRLGYRVIERGGAKPDGGVDLEIHKDNRRSLVQCKYWTSERVGVAIVRELFGVMHHEKADGAIVACAGRFTPDAQQFANANGMVLVDNRTLKHMLKQTRTDPDKFLKIRSGSRLAQFIRRGVGQIGLILLFSVLLVPVILYVTEKINSNLASIQGTGNQQVSKASMDTLNKSIDESGLSVVDPLIQGVQISRQSSESTTAFENWYKPPKDCVASVSNPKPDLVACANHRIRSRREFIESQR